MKMIPTREHLKGLIANTICRKLYWTEKTMIAEVTIDEYNMIADEVIKLIEKND